MIIQPRFVRLLLLGAFCAPPLAWAQQVPTMPQYVAGSLVKAENSVLTVRTTAGEERLVTVNDQTRWVCADSLGRQIAFADLKPGIKLTASCDPATGTANYVNVRVMEQVSGSVARLEGKKLTVTLTSDPTKTAEYVIDDQTRLQGVAKLEEVKPKHRVIVYHNTLTGAVQTVTIQTVLHFSGTLTAYDGRSAVVTPKAVAGQKAPAPVTAIMTDKTTVIGMTVKELTVGLQIILAQDLSTGYATSINVLTAPKKPKTTKDKTAKPPAPAPAPNPWDKVGQTPDKDAPTTAPKPETGGLEKVLTNGPAPATKAAQSAAAAPATAMPAARAGRGEEE